MSLLNRLSLTEQQKIAAWTACSPVFGQPPEHTRIDAYGNVIRWADYGTQGDHSWEIDHHVPNALGGSDHHSNLRGLHWQTNRSLGGLLGNTSI